MRFRDDEERANKVYSGMTPLTPDDIADMVLFAATRSPHVTISELYVVPTDQSTGTLIHRRPAQ